MGDSAGAIGFAVILTIYASVGVFAVVGSAALTKKYLPARWEQPFYAVFLMAIAGFYLAFAAYFQEADAWRTEGIAVAVFCVMAALGWRWMPVLIVGYVLHGLWDFAHELHAHGGASFFEAGQVTAIPLAYGVFCATYDIGVSVYFWMRRVAWQEARVIAKMNATAEAFAANTRRRQAQGRL